MAPISHHRLENENDSKMDEGRPYRKKSSILQIIGGMIIFAVGVTLAIYPMPNDLFYYMEIPRVLQELKVGIWMGMIITGTGMCGLFAAKKPVIGLYMGLSLMTAAMCFTGTGIYLTDVVMLQNRITDSYNSPQYSPHSSCYNINTKCCFSNDYCPYEPSLRLNKTDCAQIRKEFESCLTAKLDFVFPLNQACFFILAVAFFIVGIASIFGACNTCSALCQCKKTDSSDKSSRNIACNIYCCTRASGMSYSSLPVQPQTIEAEDDGTDKQSPLTPFVRGVENI